MSHLASPLAPLPLRRAPRPHHGRGEPDRGRRTGTARLRAPTFLLLALAIAPAWGRATALESQESPYQRGVVAAGLLLRQLDGVKRVLMIAAHPDDEDTAMLAALARDVGAQTAYLSLTRGDGGQNLVGPELFEGLGAIRTGELLAARSLDGASQYFTRAFDYGFSKSADEAFTLWPREELLADVVWVVRSFRPQVIISRFAGTPADGHGQHQAAGILARDAFQAAGDPGRFPEQLRLGVEPWQPTLLWGRADGEETRVSVETGRYDPLLGRSTFQLAMESRSRHSSQGMGAAQPPGARRSTLGLIRRAGGATTTGEGLFQGVDTTLAGLAGNLAPAVRERAEALLEDYRAELRAAREGLGALEPWVAAPPLGRALARLAEVRALTGSGSRELGDALALRERLAGRALLEVSGVQAEVRVADDLLVPGQAVEVQVQLWNGGPYAVDDARPQLQAPDGWRVTGPEAVAEAPGGQRFGPGASAPPPPGGPPGHLAPGEVARWSYRVIVPARAEPSRLYYLEAPRDGQLYRWPDEPSLWGLPKDPPLLRGGATLSLRLAGPEASASTTLETWEDGEYVGVDDVSGEFRRPVLVVPALSLAVEPGTLVWPLGAAEPRPVTVTLASQLEDGPLSGRLSLEVPEGWSLEGASPDFELAAGETTSRTFTLRPGAGAEAGRYRVRAAARTTDGRTFQEGFRLLDYPHIERVALYQGAEAGVTVVDARVAEGLSVGYVMGTGDAGPEALRQLGVETVLLDARALAEGDLSRFDALVLGVRAYEARPDLRAANQRVLDFARAGGTVVVQYNQYQWTEGGFAPYPVEISRPHDRVTDEGAAVRALDPAAPPLASPNPIGPEDWEGWVTERGLYFLGEWDRRFVPLLAMADPGEEPLRGSLLVAEVGEGLYVYTGLSFFRQLPEGVPGAYRLFANLVSLTGEEWRRHMARFDR